MSAHKNRLLQGSAIAAFAMAWNAPAYAEDTQASDTQGENVVLVTARRVEEVIQDIPVAITAFDAQAIQDRSISELEDVALLTPGLVFEDYSNGGFGTPTIRGATQFSVNQLEQNVSVFLDGIYIPRQYAFDVGSTNLERIEVVKGPQSALYGANAFAGAINYVTTNRSLTQTTAMAQLEVSENNGFDISGKLNIPVIDGMMALRAGGGISKFGGDWENNFPNPAEVNPGTNGKIGGYDNHAFNFGATVRPVETLTFDFDYYNFNISSETRAQHRLDRGAGDFNCSLGGYSFAFVPGTGLVSTPDAVENQLFCGELSVNPSPPPGAVGFPEGFVIDPRSFGLEAETEIFRANVAWELSDNLTANYLFGYSLGDVFSAGQSARNPIDGDFFRGAFVYSWSLNPIGSYDYKSHELRLQYEADSGLFVMVGAFVQNGEDQDFSTGVVLNDFGTDPFTEIPAGATPVDAFTETDTRAIFGRVSLPLMDERLLLEVEGRYTDEEKTLTDLTSPVPYEFSDKYFTPRANISFKVTEDSLIYASVARGIKSGGVNNSTLPGGAPLVADEQFYGPDSNWTYELGLKSTFLDGAATLNLAAFYIDWSDLQLSTAPTGGDATTTLVTLNVGGATIKGLEADAAIEVVDGLVLNGGIAYIDATYDDGTISSRIVRGNLCFDNTVCNANGDIGGNDLQRTSKVQWNLGAAFDTPLSGSLDLFSRVDVAGQSKQYASEINVATIEPRVLTNARLGVRGDRWSFSIWGKNIFDKKYVSNSFYIGGSPFFSVYVPTAGNRRRVGATITFDY